MDIGDLRGVITAVLLLLFIALIVWAWSRKRKDRFEEAARMPLEDDAPRADENKREQDQ